MRWPKEPGWASGSASTSSGTAGGTALATTSTLAKYCNKVSEGGMDAFCLSITTFVSLCLLAVLSSKEYPLYLLKAIVQVVVFGNIVRFEDQSVQYEATD